MAGNLRWMIDGCLAWQRDGLAPPETVRAATAGYFDNQDLFAQWVEEECDACPGDASIGDTSTNLFTSWSRSFKTLLDFLCPRTPNGCMDFTKLEYLILNHLRLPPHVAVLTRISRRVTQCCFRGGEGGVHAAIPHHLVERCCVVLVRDGRTPHRPSGLGRT